MNKVIFCAAVLFLVFASDFAFAGVEALQGVWIQECKIKKQKQEEFTGNKVTLREFYFSGANCSGEVILEVASTGEYFLDEEKLENMDFKFESVMFIPKVLSVATQFSQKSLCGFSDWSVGQAKDVSALVCDLLPPAKPLKVPSIGEMRYGIYALQTEKLFLGKLTREMNATRPELRPRELEESPFVKVAH